MKNNARMTFRCSDRSLEAVAILAEVLDTKPSDIVRTAVTEYLERNISGYSSEPHDPTTY